MKRSIVFCLFLLIVFGINAREPYGDYIVRYIVTDSNEYHRIYNPLKITHVGIRVENTNAGVKIWETEYKGPIRFTDAGEDEIFYKFHQTNQYVDFYISDRKCAKYKEKWYYVIIIDGQIQLAEPRE